MSLNYLELADVETLANLLLRSQQSKAREALCIKIGIEPYRLSFIRDSSDEDFVIQLIEYLDRIGNKESLCKLCCEELFPVFGKSEIYAPILRQIAAKLDCNQESSQNLPNSKQPNYLSYSPAFRVSVNPFNQLSKNKLFSGAIIVLIVLAGAGYRLFTNNYNGDNLGHTWIEHESGVKSTWQRIEGNKFKSRWIQPETGKEQTADLSINISNNSVKVERTNSTDGVNCNYTGELSQSGKTVSGEFNCNGGKGPWYATIKK